MKQRRAEDNQERRRSLRLKGYDYSRAGAYFVTVCTTDRGPLFGEIVDDALVENPYAKIVRRCWDALPNHYPHVTLDAFVIMPNHVHGIVVLNDVPDGTVGANRMVGSGFKPAPTGLGNAVETGAPPRHGLPEIARALKTYSARGINALRGTPGTAVWQRSYYEHVIRNEHALRRIREYIVSNPRNWQKDREHVLESW